MGHFVSPGVFWVTKGVFQGSLLGRFSRVLWVTKGFSRHFAWVTKGFSRYFAWVTEGHFAWVFSRHWVTKGFSRHFAWGPWVTEGHFSQGFSRHFAWVTKGFSRVFWAWVTELSSVLLPWGSLSSWLCMIGDKT